MGAKLVDDNIIMRGSTKRVCWFDHCYGALLFPPKTELLRSWGYHHLWTDMWLTCLHTENNGGSIRLHDIYDYLGWWMWWFFCEQGNPMERVTNLCETCFVYPVNRLLRQPHPKSISENQYFIIIMLVCICLFKMMVRSVCVCYNCRRFNHYQVLCAWTHTQSHTHVITCIYDIGITQHHLAHDQHFQPCPVQWSKTSRHTNWWMVNGVAKPIAHVSKSPHDPNPSISLMLVIWCLVVFFNYTLHSLD